MATYSRVALSESAEGAWGIKIVQTVTAGTAIHDSHATAQDELWLWAWNSRATSQLFTLEIDGVEDPDDILEVTLEPNTAGLQLIVPGAIVVTGTAAIAGFAANANEVIIHGYVNRIT